MTTVLSEGDIGPLATDSYGNLYCALSNKKAIRKVTFRFNDKPLVSDIELSSEAAYRDAQGLCVASNGDLFVTDRMHCVRQISSDGCALLHAALLLTALASKLLNRFGCMRPCLKDDTAAQAGFCNPLGIAVNADGTVFIADAANNAIRSISHASGAHLLR